MRRKVTFETDPGVEPEDIGGASAAKAGEPFDPTQIRIETKPLAVDLLVERMAKGAIDLYPDFQPKAGLWSAVDQSRLIESLLIRVPVPALYFDASDETKWLVVDGLQRLSTLKTFVVDKRLKLKGLEFLEELNGMAFGGLPRHFQRRILETQVTAHLIREGATPEVRFNIFKRINTGGTPLGAQQIRHALNQGQATRFLKLLAGSRPFKEATGMGGAGLANQECVLRGLAFLMTPYTDYRSGDLDRFLAAQMAQLNAVDGKTLRRLRADFQRALGAARAIFGDDAFRRPAGPETVRAPLNQALFEAWTATLARLDDGEIEALVERRDALKEEFTKLMSTDGPFLDSISQATGDPKKVRIRFEAVEKLIRDCLNDHQSDPGKLQVL
jgi:hypothetical protein